MSETPAKVDGGFPQRLRVARAARGAFISQVAAATGVSAQAVAKWEAGQSYPRSSHLVLLCQFLGCSLDWIMCPDPIDLTLGRPTNGLTAYRQLPTKDTP